MLTLSSDGGRGLGRDRGSGALDGPRCPVYAATASRSGSLGESRAFPMNPRSFLTSRAARTLWVVGFACLALAGPAHAQTIKPWVPPSADSLVQWASEAKVRFQAARTDSIGGASYEPYDLVGKIGRRLLRSLGRNNTIQAPAIKPVLDSLGLDTDVLVDPSLPHFVLMVVRNPHRRTATPVAFLYWYKNQDLRIQGAQLRGGRRPEMKVWWTGRQGDPYAWAVVDRSLPDEIMHLTLFRLAPDGNFWRLAQYDGSGRNLGVSGDLAWADSDGDQLPELFLWTNTIQDSLFEECDDCPRLRTELMFTDSPRGFRLYDSRLVPSPYATFAAFIHQLLENQRIAASRLLKNPDRVQDALAAGWGARRSPGTWKIEAAEPGTPWPSWLRVRLKGPQGERRWTIRFEQERGRWRIAEWSTVAPGASPGGGPASPGAAPDAGVKRGGSPR